MNGGSVFAAGSLGDEKSGAVVGRLGQPSVANSVVCRDRFPDALQGDGVRHVQMAFEAVGAAWRLDDAPAGSSGRVEGSLECGGIVRRSVTLGAELTDVKNIGRLLGEERGDGPKADGPARLGQRGSLCGTPKNVDGRFTERGILPYSVDRSHRKPGSQVTSSLALFEVALFRSLALQSRVFW